MHIRRVTVHGFKSYDDTVVFGPFEPGKNALVGLNGTGKSNFYSAIGFVLLDEYAHIRVADRKALLHEGQGQSAMTAYVEIVFDNKSRNIPIENDEVSIRRSIGLKKDEYFIDRKNSTRQDVHNLLESCGFSPSSGYYIVRQGKVNALALMKDSDRLDLLDEIAGTKFYDQQREDSIKMIAESTVRAEKINDSLKYIEDRLTQLDEEKKELEELETLDKERKAVEYLIQSNEAKRITDKLNGFEDHRKQVSDAAASLQSDYENKHHVLKEQQEQLEKLKISEKQTTDQKNKAENLKHQYIRSQTRAEIKANELTSKLQNVEQIREKLNKKLENVEATLAEKIENLRSVNEEFSKVSNEKASIQGKLDALRQIVGDKVQDPTATEDELHRAQLSLERLQEQEQNDKKNIEELQQHLQRLEEDKGKLEKELNNMYSSQREQKEELNRLMNEKKELWREEDHYEKECRLINNQLLKLRTKITSAMPRDVSSGVEAIRKMKDIEGVYDQIFDLITCPDDLATAVSVAGRGYLFHVVVENDDVAQEVIERLKKNQSGRVSFLPLNVNGKSNKTNLPEGVTTLASQLKYDKKFSKVMNFVFGKTILANNVSEAEQLVSKYQLDVVTRDGDLFYSNGPIRGGSKATSKTPVTLMALINKKEKRLAEIEAELNTSREKLSDVENRLNELNSSLQNAKNDKNSKENQRIQINLKIGDIKEDIDIKTRQLERLTSSIEEAERYKITVEKRLKYIQNFNAKSDVAKQKKELENCIKEEEKLAKQHMDLSKSRIELSADIYKSLQPHRKRLIEEIESLDVEKIQFQLQTLQKENETAQKNYEEAKAHEEELEEKLSSITKEISITEDKVIKFQHEQDTISKQLASQKNKIEQLLASISLNQQQLEECIKQQKDIGALNEEEIEEFKGQSNSELMRHLANINQDCQRFRHVNKKAIEQYRSFNQQKEDLTARQQELISSKKSITSLIDTLDERKEVAFARTFATISENFTQILSELSPYAKGQLVLQRDEETNKYIGVTIKAQFEDQEVVSIAQLSGGQKALIALTLIFAIQKYAPAPFYLFDEVDSALDDKYRFAVSKLMNKYCKPEEGVEPAQIIFTTFKKELLDSCDKYFAVKYDRGHSSAVEITEKEANSIIAEQNENE